MQNAFFLSFFENQQKCKNALIKKETNKIIISWAVPNFQYIFSLLIMVVNLRIGEIIQYFESIIMS